MAVMLCCYGYLQIYIDATLTSYMTSLVTSLPWLLVITYATYCELAVSMVTCVVLGAVGFVGHTVLMTVLPSTGGYTVANMVSTYTLCVLLAHLLDNDWQ